MQTQSNSNLSQVRKAMLAGVSAMAICLAAPHAAHSGSLTVEGEGSWLEPFGDEVIYSDLRAIGAADVNQLLDRGDDFSMRGQVTKRFNNAWSISIGGGAASFGNSETAPSANLYTALPNSFLIPQIITVPNFIAFCATCENIYTSAQVDLDTDLDFIDFDVGKDVGIGTNGKARFFAGIRYARFDEDLRGTFSNFQYAFYYFQTLNATRKSSFEGLGPRAGFTAEVPIGKSKFTFGGTFAVAALFGEVKTNISATHVSRTAAGVPFATNTFGTSSTSKDDVAYTVEVAPQISYHFGGRGNMSGKVSVGYRFDHYLGMVDTSTRQTTVAGVPPGGDPNDDAKFDGFFVRLGMTFGANSE